MKTYILVLAASIGIGGLMPLSVQAETVVRTGSSISVASTQSIGNDFYAAGNSVSHSGEVKEDLYAVAGSVTINGVVGKDLTAIGGTVQIHAPIGDDIRVVAGDAVVASKVTGDLFVIGGRLQVLSSAEVGGNIYFYGGEAEIDGVVKGSVMGRAESYKINSEVAGIDVTAMRISLGDKAVVQGDVRYAGASEIDRAVGATVKGEILQGNVDVTESGPSTAGIVFVLAWVFTSLCFFLLLRAPLENVLAHIKQDPLRVGLAGMVMVIGLPVLGFVLLATVLGLWIGVVVILFTILIFILGLIIMPILLGGYVSGLLFKQRRLNALTVAWGVLVLILLAYVPFVGGLLLAAVFLMTLGAIGYGLYRSVKPSI